ncbi:MAM and LDL-receptor class A domain-containing protein 1-like isoform X2 [Dreissena polymorpha]|uniref:MAM and LDL-receptor class A domain-containing protein 1-like isoform X2 n=1 Tax=Dreissena polymorpha TaxID=45954 RepID=UPI00226438AB|nr:MAM and LDL-receptor class A domain-containing protein 1-like isoform X2 [Dreissena polymorpha]
MDILKHGLKSTEVHSQPDLRSDILGYLDNGECFHGYYTEGNDWVTVIDEETEIHIGRGSLFPCDPKTFPNEDIHARLRLPHKKEMFGNHFLRSVGLKRFLLDTQSLNRAQCNFDLDSLCSWRNVHGQDDFDWVLYQSSTPTDDTGPDFDHTLRNATGKYVFIESSAPRRLFDAAWLQSPIIEAIGQLIYCFRFWYHMYGTSTGRLDVYQALETFVPGNLMWSVTGDHGNAWLQGQVALESAQNYSIIISGFVGNGYLGDIAIDDVSLSDGYCDVKPPSASRSDVSNSTLSRDKIEMAHKRSDAHFQLTVHGMRGCHGRLVT